MRKRFIRTKCECTVTRLQGLTQAACIWLVLSISNKKKTIIQRKQVNPQGNIIAGTKVGKSTVKATSLIFIRKPIIIEVKGEAHDKR